MKKANGKAKPDKVYVVVVGNIGNIAASSKAMAMETFEHYETLSKRRIGSAAGEPVTLLEDGNPIKEYRPQEAPKILYTVHRVIEGIKQLPVRVQNGIQLDTEILYNLEQGAKPQDITITLELQQ